MNPSWANDSDSDDDDDLEKGNSKQEQAQSAQMEVFFKYVDTIKADIEMIAKATKKINLINEKALQATTTQEENELSKQLRPLISETNEKAKGTKRLLGLLKEDTEKLKSEKRLNVSDERWD